MKIELKKIGVREHPWV